MTVLETALAYASYGLHVFPCEPQSKRPLGSLVPHGHLDATTDAETIRQWFTTRPDANLAVATGPSRLLVVDIDGPEGEETVEFLADNLSLTLPTTRASLTGRSNGGRHLWFTLPAGAPRIPSRAAALGPSVDIRADGGYVVAPPSIHATGSSYSWATPPGTPFATVPTWIIEGQAKPSRSTPRDPSNQPQHFVEGTGETTNWGSTALQGECDRMRHAPEGTRNQTLNETAFRIGQVIGGGHLDPEEATLAIFDAATDAGLPEAEVRSVLGRALAAGAANPRGPQETNIPANWDPRNPNAALDNDPDLELTYDYEPPTIEIPVDSDEEPALPPNPPPTRIDKGLAIVTNNSELEHLADLAFKALINLNNRAQLPRILQRNGQLVRLRNVPRADGSAPLVIEPLTVDSLRLHLSEGADWVTRKVDQKATDASRENDPQAPAIIVDTHVSPPLDVTRAVLARSEFPRNIPIIEGLISTPVMRPDGSVLHEVGWDRSTGLVYNPVGKTGIDASVVPENPTDKETQAAVTLLLEPFTDFPFIDEADRSNMLALLLTPMLRAAIDGPTPMALVSATQPGTGKSKLMDVISIVTTGQEGIFTTAPKDEEEWQKKLLAMLIRNQPLTTFDNLSTQFASGELCAALTAPTYSGRPLGRTEIIDLPVRTTWAATGNNISVDGEVGRRSYWITLDAKTDNPAGRTGWKHDPLTVWVKAHRSELIISMLTLCRSWFANGCPTPPSAPIMGSYEDWVRVVGGTLENAGIKGFLSNAAAKAADADPDSTNWRSLLEYLSQTKTCQVGHAFTAAEAASVIQFGDAGVTDPTASGRTLGDLASDATKTGAVELLPTKLARSYGKDNFSRFLAEAFRGINGRRFGTTHLRIERVGQDRRHVATYAILEGV